MMTSGILRKLCFSQQLLDSSKHFNCLNYARLQYLSMSLPVTSNGSKKDKKTTMFTKPFDTIVKVIPKRLRKKEKIDLTKEYTDNIYITPGRAMNEYLLQQKHLDSLQKYYRRSPYAEYGGINVFLRRDVENIASNLHGTLEEMQTKKQQLKESRDIDNQSITELKKELKRLTKDYHSQHRGVDEELPFLFKPFDRSKGKQDVFSSYSGRVVIYAVSVNAANCILKFFAWIATGSHSMFSEFIHSIADTANQLILAYGLHKSVQEADSEHPYGWASFRNVASLISGIGIFFLGCGFCISHGITAILNPVVFEYSFWAMMVLGFSFISESATLGFAVYAVQHQAKAEKMKFLDYVYRAADPSTNVVLLEDLASVLGVTIASSCMYLTYITNNGVFDGIGSIMIGSLLGITASFVVYTNTQFLVGRSITPEKKILMMKELESDRIIRALHDVKATEMGGSEIKFKAEVDFDGKEITRLYLENQDLDQILQDLKQMESVEEFEQFMLKHGENVVDFMGSEVDRVENKFKKLHPEVRHMDLEQL